MCDPVTAAAGLMFASGLASGAQQSAQLRGQARMEEAQAKIGDAQAADAERRGGIEEERFRMQFRQLQGQARARLGASGIASDTGSALDVQGQNARFGELDALTIRNNAAREAWGLRTDSFFRRQQARAYRQGAKSALAGGVLEGALGAGGTYLGGK